MNRAFRSTLCLAFAAFAAGADGVSEVTHVKVLSDKVPDVSSIDAWKAWAIKPGMSDADKALACWKTVWTFQYQDAPPAEFLEHEELVYDAIKLFNVYGYAMCCNACAHQESLAREVGLEARGWAINRHSVSEIRYDGAWHLFDPSLINYFPKADGVPAGVEEITAGVQAWYREHPDFWTGKGGDNDKLVALHKEGGWQGWRKGPDVLSRCPTWGDRGWYPAKTHGWYSTMQEYDGGNGGDGKQFLYEYGASQGYQVDIRLRPGERIVRNWSNHGLHVNMRNDSGNEPGCLKMTADQMVYSVPNGDLANGRVGNGTHTWAVPLGDARMPTIAWTWENAVGHRGDKKHPTLRAKDPTKDAVVVLRMPSSYVYLSGTASLSATIVGKGSIGVQFSDNNGLDWKDVATLDEHKDGAQQLDLTPFCFRRYDYLLKLTLRGELTGIDALTIAHDIQHSQRPLPALAQGENKLSFSCGGEDTVTVEASPSANAKKLQVTIADTHATLAGMDASLKLTSGDGSVTVPIRAPADIVRLRFGAFYRTWSDQDGWTYEVSFDDGKTFAKVCDAPKQVAGCTKYVTVTDIPKGARAALVRYSGHAVAGTELGNYRIDADYVAPGAGVAPVKVTYAWTEDGQAKTDTHVTAKAADAWTITCAAKPTMASIALELAE